MTALRRGPVAAGLAEKCEVQAAYAIGIAEPVSVFVDTFGTGKISRERLVKLVYKCFPLKPGDIIKHFRLLEPIYLKTSCYGHFGKLDLPWERTDKAEILRKLGLKTER